MNDSDLQPELRTIRAELAGIRYLMRKRTASYLSLRHAAEYLGVSVSTIKRLKHLHRRVGRSVRIKRSDLDNELAKDHLL